MEKAISVLIASVGLWRSLQLSIMSRIALTKMVVLPRLLYFFANLPIWLPPSWFKDLDLMIRDLIWDKGRRRVALTTLKLPMTGG